MKGQRQFKVQDQLTTIACITLYISMNSNTNQGPNLKHKWNINDYWTRFGLSFVVFTKQSYF